MILMVISGIIGYLLFTEYTLKNEEIPHTMTMDQYLNFYYMNNHPRFNYFNGLYIAFYGLMISGLFMIHEATKKHK